MLLEIQNLSKQYKHNGNAVDAIKEVSVNIEKGKFVTITGPSGSGKSTLLFTLGGLIRPTSGSIKFNGQPLHNASDDALAEFRKNHVGYVMQNYCLVPYLTAQQNVMIPLSISRISIEKQKELAKSALEIVGLEDRLNHFPKELSAGQQQRVAIARALINKPSIILADEPTGNLDPALARDILELLTSLNEKEGVTIIMVTHSPDAATYGNMLVQLREGQIIKNN